MTYYRVPQRIAEELNLSRLRRQDSDGYYIVSQSDIVAYGVKKALGEGAKPICRAEAMNRVKKSRNLNNK